VGSTFSETDRVRIPAFHSTVGVIAERYDHRDRRVRRHETKMRTISLWIHDGEQIKDENITRTFREYDTLPVRQAADLYKEGTALFRVGHKVLLMN
jgi:hypothetical protein